MGEASNRDHLLGVATRLFRQRGYDGVGLAEILKAAGLPKGSLYYHFPGGKRELAEAATLSAGAMVEGIVDKLFAEVTDFTDGAARLCDAIAGLVAQQDQVLACPVASILQAGAQEARLRAAGRRVLAGWMACLAQHAKRLGHPDADTAAEMLVMQLEGAWMLALAEQSSGPIERLAAWIRSKAAAAGGGSLPMHKAPEVTG